MPTKYRCIVCDPPWDERKNYVKGMRIPYPVMSIDELAALPVPELAQKDCHLYLWALCHNIPQACWLMAHWGFRYNSIITWVKPGGIGHWWSIHTEHLLFGYRGGISMRTRHLPNVFGANRRRHSRKPEESYQLIEKVSCGPYLEMFARYPRVGWDCWGNEVQGISLPVPPSKSGSR